ncbi:unnamed protein product, partial [Medioppia subpectinata]
DFKPASVDREKAAVMDVEGNHKVTVTAPNTEGSGTSETVFKGSRKAHQKECVLIIDHKTGEITLEKLHQNITVKRTRQQNPTKAHKQLTVRPNTPNDSKKLVPQLPHSQQKPNSPLTTNRQNSPNNANNKQKSSPNKANPNGQTHSQSQRKSPSSNQPISPSMPTLDTLHSMTTNGQQPAPPNNKPTPNKLSGNTVLNVPNSGFAHNINKRDINEELGLSDSSDSSDHESSSSSSDSSSESSSDDEEEDRKPTHSTNTTNTTAKTTTNNTNSKPNTNGNKPKATVKSDQSSSDDSDDSTHASNTSKHNGIGVNGNTQPVLPSMPKFSQLSEDLRLSESGSDSDD